MRRPVLYKGRQVFVEGSPLFDHEYSDNLLIFLLKAHAPERFRDRIDVKNLHDFDLSKLTPVQADALMDALLKREFGDAGGADVKAQLDAGVTVDAVCERLSAAEERAFECCGGAEASQVLDAGG